MQWALGTQTLVSYSAAQCIGLEATIVLMQATDTEVTERMQVPSVRTLSKTVVLEEWEENYFLGIH